MSSAEKVIDIKANSNVRYYLIDSLRGLALISMILYHAMYDIVYIFGVDIGWYCGWQGYAWQQSICWTFILLAGMSWSLGKNPLKRGAITFCLGALITLATILFMPEEKIIWGVLSLIGALTLLMIPLEKILKKINPIIAIIICGVLFILTKNIDLHYIGIGSYKIIELPIELYNTGVLTIFGFPSNSFSSSDYFPIIPWFFIYLVGYYIYLLILGTRAEKYLKIKLMPFDFIGKKSILIYILHQTVILGVLYLAFLVIK